MAELNPAASHHVPAFITSPGETDVLMVIMSLFLVFAVLGFGILFLRLHTLPERIAHKSHKIQFEIVAVLGLIALFTHMHIFWIAGLLLALIDLPDFPIPVQVWNHNPSQPPAPHTPPSPPARGARSLQPNAITRAQARDLNLIAPHGVRRS